MKKIGYQHENELKDGAGQVTSPVRVAEEGPDQGAQINSPGPLAHIVGCTRIPLLENSGQKKHQVHSHPEEC